MTRRANARIAGFAFLLYIAVGITQMVLGGATRAAAIGERLAAIAQHVPLVRANILLSLLLCVTALTLAVALYALTREQDRDLAVLALCCRVGEGLITAIATMTGLGLLWLATLEPGPESPDPGSAHALAALLLSVRGWSTTITATLFAMGSTLFSWLLLRGRMIPAPLAVLGVAASLLLVVALPLDLVGVLPGSVTAALWLPM